MRWRWLGALAGALSGLVIAGTAVAASASVVVIQADQGKPIHLAAYRGPDGALIPVGACAAVLGGRVWVLPCTDPRAVAYRQVAAARAARVARQTRWLEVIGVLVGATLAASVVQSSYGRSQAAITEG